MSPSPHVAGLCAALLAVASHLSGCAVESSSSELPEGETAASTTAAVPGTTTTFLGTTVEAETTAIPDTTGTFLGTTVEAETTTVPDTTGAVPGTGHEGCEDNDTALVELIELVNFYNLFLDLHNHTFESEFGFHVTGCEDAAFLGWCIDGEIVVSLCCATCEAYGNGAGESCSSHSCGAGEFCFAGHCATCDECHYCHDGVDGTCGSCGDGFPTLEDGPCTTGVAEATTEPPVGV